jgi:hypothetical protein
MSAAIDAYIEEARKVTIEDVFALAGGDISLMKKRIDEFVGPCPVPHCGGKDRFSINFAKGLWHCRGCEGGSGGDGFKLMANVHGFNLKTQVGLLGVCQEITGKAPPDASESETEEERVQRLERNALRRQQAEADRSAQDKDENRHREFAINQGRGFWLNARDAEGSPVEAYLKLRTGANAIPARVWENLKFAPRHSYTNGKDDRGHEIEIHCGPAMIAPMVSLDGKILGCHRTWIDLSSCDAKFRPVLSVINARGEREDLVTKKMRGHKKGSIIPICGDLEARRWICGEGIETTSFIAGRDGWRSDTFYFAAGDIGNMAGPADAKSSFNHPTARHIGNDGKSRPVKVAGPVPKPASEADAFQLPPHVELLVLLADGDSEQVFTLSSMARAVARLTRPGLDIAVWWPPEGMDWGDVADLVASEKTDA